MSYPSDQNLLRSLLEAASGSTSETYTVPGSPYKHVLGSSLSPAMPSGWPLKISGAAPINPPSAPTAGTPATTTTAGHNLTATGTYSWRLTSVTQFGETTPSAAFAPGALGAGVTGYNLAIPSVSEGTADAPVLYRKLYRTTNGGSTFYWVADIDLTTTSYLDGKPDSDLEVAAPSTNTSGSEGAVTLTVNGTAGTEMPPGTTLAANQFIVDYSLSNTAGTITHYSGDVGKTVVATYVGANLLSAALLNAVITAIKSIVTAFGTPGSANGTPTLNGSALVVQDPASKGTASGVAGYDSRGLITRPTGTSAPNLTPGAGWPGGTYSLTAGSDSRSGQIVITPNANLAANTSLINLAVNPTLGAIPRGAVVGQSGGSAWVGFWVSKITNGFTLINASPLSSGVTYAADYVIEP